MNRPLFADALSQGVRAAFLLSFDQAVAEIERLDLRSGDSICAESGEQVHWSLSALQVIDDDELGASVEISVSATDGIHEESVLVYIRANPRPLTWGLSSNDDLDSMAKAIRRAE